VNDDKSISKITPKDIQRDQNDASIVELPYHPETRFESEATVLLPSSIYAPWMRSIKELLSQVGAENGEDYKAMVSLAGKTKKGESFYRIKWSSLNNKGHQYLLLMAKSLAHHQLQMQKMLENKSAKRLTDER